MSENRDLKLIEALVTAKKHIFNEISNIIIGQEEILDHLLISLLCKGHTLLVGVPGLAKTLIIKSISELLELDFSRIQFTPDLMPSDITGTEVIEEDHNTGKREFRFFHGPVFANIILADEINRTPPKTQAALLEAMQEYHVTAAGRTYNLDEPFFVLATQNPIEQEGTYPLPEAQLDRFMFNLKMNYPSREEEVRIVLSTTSHLKHKLKVILSKKELLKFQELVRRVPVAENVVQYAVQLAGSTRPGSENAPDFINEWIDWGAGPRASQFLILGAKARAILDGRATPDIQDVKALVHPVFRHRILPNFNAEAEGLKVDDILDRLLEVD